MTLPTNICDWSFGKCADELYRLRRRMAELKNMQDDVKILEQHILNELPDGSRIVGRTVVLYVKGTELITERYDT